MKTYFNVKNTVGKYTTTDTVESLMSDHFTRLVSFYSQYRTFDQPFIFQR